MKSHEDLQKVVQNEILPESLNLKPGTGIIAKSGKSFTKLIYLTSIVGIGLLFNACTTTGYVATEPVYIEHARPAQPSTLHVWVDGDWVYNRQTRVYVRNEGYWQKPNTHRTYVQGSWQSSPRGHYWSHGHYRHNR